MASQNTNGNAPKSKPQKKERRRININIGMIIFIIIFVYMGINIILYFQKDHISVVEVQKGSIVDNGYYTGIILREEELVTVKTSGYINFYIDNGEKVAKNSRLYMINTSGQNDWTTSDFSGLTLSDYSGIGRIISVYSSNYSDSQYADLYTFKYDLQNEISEAISSHNIAALQNSGNDYQSITSSVSGIVSYTYDGMENLTKEQITDNMFNSNSSEKHQIMSNQWVDSGKTACRVVTSDNWSIIIKLTSDQAARLSKQDYVNLKFSKDNVNATANIDIFTNGESNYACLSLRKYMSRYIADRFIDIEIIESSAEGIKIPASAVVKQDFYKIPAEYLITEKDSNEEGFYRYIYDDNGELKVDFYKTDIYDRDEQYCYVHKKDFELGDYIGQPNSGDRYRIGPTQQLTGVYNINKGYTVFRIIDILYQNDEYYIVARDTPYGLSLYDRIVLNASQVKEDEMIY